MNFRYAKGACWVIGGMLLIAVVFAPLASWYLLEPPAVFWAQVLSGNWNSNTALTGWWPSYQAGLAAALAILLNNGILFAALGLLWVFATRERQTEMQVNQMYALKEIVTRQALAKQFAEQPGAVEKIETAFEEGEQAWLGALSILIGDKEAERLMNLLKKTESLEMNRKKAATQAA